MLLGIIYSYEKNAASFYPVLTTRNTQSIFRLSALLDDKVDPEKLRQALCEAIVRFPLFKVRQRTGVFWYYFEENEEPFNIFEDDGILLRRIDTKKTNGYQFRLCYFGKKIADSARYFPRFNRRRGCARVFQGYTL